MDFQRFAIYWIVIIGGAAVLALEIVGTRVLGPFYGVSLFVWSALITVTLLALSIGYTLGGRLADRRPRLSGLAWVPGAAGLWTLLLPWLRHPVLTTVEPLGLRAGVLLSAFILFGPPLALLGMIGPYAIRLRAGSLNDVGRTAGRIYALSTVASVVAALLTGFYLIPVAGVRRMLFLVGGLLVASSLLAMLSGRRSTPARALGILLIPLAAAGAMLARSESTLRADSVIALEQSPYGEIRVLDTQDERFLLIDGGVHTRVDAASRRTTFRYVVALKPVMLQFAPPGRALVLGLGGGTAARFLADDGWRVDGVDVDPVVIRFAQDLFGLRADQATLYEADARRFLVESQDKYELVVVDAYGSAAMPFHLASTEFFAQMKSRMTNDGMVAVNVYDTSWDGPIVKAISVTLAVHFGEVQVLPTQEPPNTLGNLVVVAGDRPLTLADDALPRPEENLEDPYAHWLAVQMNHAWDNRFHPETTGAPVLTDDRNPIELWYGAVHVASRADLIAVFGDDALLW